jgi:hypothetical protein
MKEQAEYAAKIAAEIASEERWNTSVYNRDNYYL